MSPLSEALFLMAGYNTAIVCVGTALLGAAAGAIGSFILLRRRSLASDAAGHATLPGLGLAFIIMALAGNDGRWLPGLMAGALLSAALGLVCVQAISRHTGLPEDAAIGAVLSVFFGLGIVMLTIVQSLPTGRQAGLASYLLGSAAGMLRHEAEFIAVLAMLVTTVIAVLHRPLVLLCFERDYARSQGLPVDLLDLILSGLLLALIVTSIKIVGVVLSVALSITPAVTARFWTNQVNIMVPISATLGALGGHIGAALSSITPDLPTGAVIVLVLFALFLASLLLAPTNGILVATFSRHRPRIPHDG